MREGGKREKERVLYIGEREECRRE